MSISSRLSRPKNYAVVVTYSFDAYSYCKLFETLEEALHYAEWDWKNEIKIDTEENGWDVAVSKDYDKGEFILTDLFRDRNETTTWRVVEIINDVQGS